MHVKSIAPVETLADLARQMKVGYRIFYSQAFGNEIYQFRYFGYPQMKTEGWKRFDNIISRLDAAPEAYVTFSRS